VLAERAKPTQNPAVGSRAWAAKICDSAYLVDVFEKWRLLTGDARYDDFLRQKGSAYLRYRLTGDVKPLVARLEGVVKDLSSRVEMSTSEVLFTDRVSMPGAGILFQMMTGSVGRETYYPMHAVTWEQTGNRLAALVESASSRDLRVLVYRFEDEGGAVTMRPWRLAPGDYAMTVAPADIDDANPTAKQPDRSVALRERGQRLSVTVPAGQLLRVTLAQQRRQPTPPGPRADLALGPDAITLPRATPVVGKTMRLRVTVHNVGLAAAKGFCAELYDGQRRIASLTLPDLPAPIDLKPKIASAEVDWTPHIAGRRQLCLVVDPHDALSETVELNNHWTVAVEVR